MTTDFTCAVDAAAFAKTALAQSKDAMRYYICGVYVEPAPEGQTGVYMVATDGHAMVVRYDPTGVCMGSGIVSLDAAMLKAAAKTQRHQSVNNRLIVRGSQACIAWGVSNDDAPTLDFGAGNVNAVQMRNALVDGNFPDWRRILPKATDPSAPVAAMDAIILERLSAALRADGVQTEHKGFLRITSTGASNIPVIAHGTDDMAFGIVMPVRSELPTSIPVWYTTANATDAAAV